MLFRSLLVPRLAATEPLAQLAASLLTVADTPFRIRGVGQGVRVALSVGATVVDGSQASAAAVLAEAGMARRLASAEAGSAFRLIDESMRREVHDAFTRQSHFREALLQGGVLPYFQPIVDLRQGRILGFEALARWRRADGGVAPPSEFLSLARQMGLTGDLDLEVIRQVLEALPAFAAVRGSADPGDSDEALVMSVNLSAQLLDDPDLRARLLALLERCAIPAGLRLQVEILEEALQDASEGFEEFLSRLSVRDVAIAIDDFGTGYSSLSRLDQLPIQSFKVDRSFVERIDDGLSPSNQLLRTMNRLATDLGLAVTAEGVRTEAQRDWLQRHGFVNGQGYLFSRPLPLDEALACLRRQGIAPLPIPAPASREESGAAAGPEAAPALGAGLGRLLRGWLAGEPPAPPS